MYCITLLCKMYTLQASSLMQSTFCEYLCKYFFKNVSCIPKLFLDKRLSTRHVGFLLIIKLGTENSLCRFFSRKHTQRKQY